MQYQFLNKLHASKVTGVIIECKTSGANVMNKTNLTFKWIVHPKIKIVII